MNLLQAHPVGTLLSFIITVGTDRINPKKAIPIIVCFNNDGGGASS